MAAAALALLALAPGCRRGEKTSASGLPIGLVTDVAGRGDQSFNDGALRGLEEWAGGVRHTPGGYVALTPAERAATIPSDLTGLELKPLGVRPVVLQAKAQEDYEPDLELVASEGAELVVGVGFMLERAVEAAARKRPGTRFLLIDSPIVDASGKPQELPNVQTVVFREQEGAFLAGALAALASRSGKVGFVGGMEIPLLVRFEAGFAAGAQAGRPGVSVRRVYTGNFDDSASGQRAAEGLFAQGVDVVFHGAGMGGLGVIAAARERGKLAIGVDSDQAHLAPEHVLTSMLKHVDLAVFEAARAVVEHRFAAGSRVLGLAEGGVALAPVRIDFPGKAEALRRVEELRRAVVERRVAVPSTLEELARFSPPPSASR
jgi:basic membrane protein A